MRLARPRLLRRAFTLIELIAVIVVIALLLGLAAFGYSRFISGARETSVNAVAVQVGKAIQAHSAHHQLPYNEDNYDQATVDEALGSDLPHGEAGEMANTTSDAGDLTATIVVEHEGRTAEVVFERDAIGGPGRVGGIGVAAGEPDSEGTEPPDGEPTGPTHASEVLADNPVAFYRFDDPFAYPAAAGAHTLTGSGTLTPTAGPHPGATALTTASGAMLSSGLDIDSSAFSFAGWIRTTDTSGVITAGRGHGIGVALSVGNSPAGGGGPGRLNVLINGPNLAVGVYTTATINDGAWHHVVGTWNGTAGAPIGADQFRLYVDGEPAATSPAVYGTTTAPIRGYGYRFGDDPGLLGTANGPLDGSLYRPALWVNTALTAADAAALHAADTAASYDAAVTSRNPDGFWTLEEDVSSTLTDSSPQGRTGMHITGGAAQSAALVGDGHALTLPGSGQVGAQAPGAPWMNVEEFTVSAWIQPARLDRRQTLVTRDNVGLTSELSWRIRTDGASVQVIANTSTGVHTITGNPLLTTTAAHHVAATYDGTTLSLYVDGVLDTSRVINGALHKPAATPFRIGVLASAYEPYAGVIDEVAFFDTALPAGRILTHATTR